MVNCFLLMSDVTSTMPKVLRGNTGNVAPANFGWYQGGGKTLATLLLFVTGLCRKAGPTARPARAVGPEPG